MRIYLPFAVLSAVASPVAHGDEPQGIDYLGAGYDLVFGNPDGSEASSSVTDPGFRVHLIKFTWDDDDDTCSGLNNNWTCPSEVSIMPDTSCVQQSSSTAITTTKDFQKTLQHDCSVTASISGSYGGFSAEASFSGSNAMESMQDKISNEDVTTYQSQAVCVEYTATLKLGFGPSELQPLPEFVAAVGNLPLAYNPCYMPDSDGGPCPQRVESGFGDLPPVKNDTLPVEDESGGTTLNECACDATVADYFRFIQLFGTHYTTRIEMGGKIVHRLEIKNSEVEKLSKENVDVAYGASIKASYEAIVASASVSVDATNSKSDGASAYSKVMAVAQKELNINVGGSPSEDWHDWAQSTSDTPMPIRYRLSSLVDLIQNVDSAKVPHFEAAVKDYIAAYGKTVTLATAKEAKVQTLQIQYSLDTPMMGWVVFQVMIGVPGSMNPAAFNVTNTVGTLTVDVPPQYKIGLDSFDTQVPITFQYVTGRLYPPVAKVAMEAKKVQRHGMAKKQRLVNMEASLAMGMKATFGFTTPSSVTLIMFNKSVIMDDNSVQLLDEPYNGKQLQSLKDWTVNPNIDSP